MAHFGIDLAFDGDGIGSTSLSRKRIQIVPFVTIAVQVWAANLQVQVLLP